MAGKWAIKPFSEAVLINPRVPLEQGKVYPFVDMQAVDPNSRSVRTNQNREFTGGGSRFAVGDTLMARITPCLENGKIAQYADDDTNAVGHGSTEFIVIRGRPEVSDTGFAYYLTRWDEVRLYAVSQMTGSSGRQRVPTESLRHLQIQLPSIAEQKAIASILGALDDKIELNRRMNETLEAMARTIFKSWFVDFDPIPLSACGHAQAGGHGPHREWQDSPLGRIPKGWKATDVGALAEVTSGKRPPVRFSEPNDDARVPLWGGNGPMGFVATPLYESHILLTGRVGTLGSIFRITSPCWPSDNTLLVLARDPRSHEFLYFQLKQVDFTSLNRGSTQPLLTQTDLKAQKFVLPPKNLLDRFHSVVGSLFSRIDASRDESRTLAALRDALLPKLLSGEVRVKDAEKFMEQSL